MSKPRLPLIYRVGPLQKKPHASLLDPREQSGRSGRRCASCPGYCRRGIYLFLSRYKHHWSKLKVPSFLTAEGNNRQALKKQLVLRWIHQYPRLFDRSLALKTACSSGKPVIALQNSSLMEMRLFLTQVSARRPRGSPNTA